MRSRGQGYAGIEKFTSLMNIDEMPKPMTQNNYVKSANIMIKSVAEETIADAVIEIRNNAGDEILNTSVSCDGSWQRRRYSSLNGVVTVISMDTGKILDCEPMSRYCTACNLK